MIFCKMESLEERSESLKKEYAELVILLGEKRREIDSLSAGYEKYKNDQALMSQLCLVLEQKLEEIMGLNKRIDALGRGLKEARGAMNRVFEETMRQAHAPQAEFARPIPSQPADKIVRIAFSPAVSASLEKALANEPHNPEIINTLSGKKAEVNETIVIEDRAGPQKDQAADDLYDKAAQEARAQEKFLTQLSKSSKDYGAV